MKKVDLRKPKFKKGQLLTSKDLNNMWKDLEKLKRKMKVR